MVAPEDPDFVRCATVAGTLYRIEYSFLALARLERAYEKSYTQIARQLSDGQGLSVDLAVELIRAGLNGAGEQRWTTAAVAKLYEELPHEERSLLANAAMDSFAALFVSRFAKKVAEKKGPGPATPPATPTGPVSSAPPPA